jgi:hypothetical protein
MSLDLTPRGCPRRAARQPDASFSNVYLMGLDETTNYSVLGRPTRWAGQETRTSAQPPYRAFRRAGYFAQRRVLHFHDCAHGTVYAEDKNVTGFDVSWEPHHGAVDGSDASNVYITGSGRSHNIYFLGEEFRRNQRKLGGSSALHRTEYPRCSEIFRSTTYLYLMTVHMETVYADNKNVTSLTFPGAPTAPWIARIPPTLYITGCSTEYTFFGWVQNSAGISKLGGC